MKKIFSLFLMLFVVVILSGCQKTQVLTCESIVDEDGLKTTQVYKMTYEGEEIKEAKVMTSFEPEDTSYYDMYANLMDEVFNKMEETKGITIETSSNNPVYDVDITIDFNKVTEETKMEELNLDMAEADFEVTINELKKDMEDTGLTCKIK